MAIVALTKNYKAAMKKGSKLRLGWKKPPKGKVMVNVDAAFNEDEGCGSVGAIIRDCSGGALAAAHSFVPHLIDAPMAEAYALKEGLMLAQHIGCKSINRPVRLYGSGTNNEQWRILISATSAAALCDECNIIWSEFQDISIEHCSREVNQVAHNLAKRAMQLKQTCTWIDEPLSFILDLLTNNVTILNE
jgi:ribonuclease HI